MPVDMSASWLIRGIRVPEDSDMDGFIGMSNMVPGTITRDARLAEVQLRSRLRVAANSVLPPSGVARIANLMDFDILEPVAGDRLVGADVRGNIDLDLWIGENNPYPGDTFEICLEKLGRGLR